MKVKIAGHSLSIGKWKTSFRSVAEAIDIIIRQNYNGTRVSIVPESEKDFELAQSISKAYKNY